MRVGLVLLNKHKGSEYDCLIGKEVEILSDCMYGLSKVYTVTAVIDGEQIFTCFERDELEDRGNKVILEDWVSNAIDKIDKKIETVGVDDVAQKNVNSIIEIINKHLAKSTTLHIDNDDLGGELEYVCGDDIEEYIDENFIKVTTYTGDSLCSNCSGDCDLMTITLFGNDFVVCQECIFDIIDYLVVKSNSIE